jgi:hypothetical protein
MDTPMMMPMPSTPEVYKEQNEYDLLNFKGEKLNDCQKVVFYKLNDDGTSENGTTIEEMLRVSIERLNSLNKRFPCRENALAITKMEEALMWLNKRTENRIARGVEGKHLI